MPGVGFTSTFLGTRRNGVSEEGWFEAPVTLRLDPVFVSVLLSQGYTESRTPYLDSRPEPDSLMFRLLGG